MLLQTPQPTPTTPQPTPTASTNTPQPTPTATATPAPTSEPTSAHQLTVAPTPAMGHCDPIEFLVERMILKDNETLSLSVERPAVLKRNF